MRAVPPLCKALTAKKMGSGLTPWPAAQDCLEKQTMGAG